MSSLITFDEAIADAKRHPEPLKVVLGNGFSIACRPEIFTYHRLLDEAAFPEGRSDLLRGLFDRLGTTDFERVIEALMRAGIVIDHYGADPSLTALFGSDAEVVREALAHVLAARHPELCADITDEECSYARQFLSNFSGIYTLNYDLLLYWALMRTAVPPAVRSDDGFRNADLDAAWVDYQPYKAYDQNVFYIHGGLHLFDDGIDVHKLTWSRTEARLIDQIRDALEQRRYPLVVTEGTSEDKKRRITHSALLFRGMKSLVGATGSLFTFGLSFAPNDEHLLEVIAEGKLKRMYVGIYGSADTPDNARIIQRAEALAAGRPARKPLAVRCYQAESASVWGSAQL